MIVAIFTMERNPRTGQMEQVAANGMDIDTLRDVHLPLVSAQELGAVYDHDLGEYILTQ
jgi:hypothetical protein